MCTWSTEQAQPCWLSQCVWSMCTYPCGFVLCADIQCVWNMCTYPCWFVLCADMDACLLSDKNPALATYAHTTHPCFSMCGRGCLSMIRLKPWPQDTCTYPCGFVSDIDGHDMDIDACLWSDKNPGRAANRRSAAGVTSCCLHSLYVTDSY